MKRKIKRKSGYIDIAEFKYLGVKNNPPSYYWRREIEKNNPAGPERIYGVTLKEIRANIALYIINPHGKMPIYNPPDTSILACKDLDC